MGVLAATTLSVDEFTGRLRAQSKNLFELADLERGKPGSVFIDPDFTLIGTEVEGFGIRRDGRLAHGMNATVLPAAIRRAMEDPKLIFIGGNPKPDQRFQLSPFGEDISGFVVPELGSCSWELVGGVHEARDAGLRNIEKTTNLRWRLICEEAAKIDVALLQMATVPTIQRDDLDPEHISPSKASRFGRLNAGLMGLVCDHEARRGLQPRGIFRVNLLPRHPGQKGVRWNIHRNVMGLIGAYAFQTHLGTSLHDLPSTYNWSCVVDAFITAIGVNGGPIAGRKVWKDPRAQIWNGAIAGGYSEGDLIIFGRGFMDEDNPERAVAEWFAQNLNRPVLIPFDIPPDGDFPFTETAIQNGTCWTVGPRPCLGKIWDSKTERSMLSCRVESRIEGSGPLPELFARFWARACLVEAFRKSGASVRNVAEWRDVVGNADTAMHLGLDGKPHWKGGSERTFREIWKDELIDLVKQGHRLLGLDDRTLSRYLPMIYFALEHGTGADIYDRVWDSMDASRDWRERATELVQFVARHQDTGFRGMANELGIRF